MVGGWWAAPVEGSRRVGEWASERAGKQERAQGGEEGDPRSEPRHSASATGRLSREGSPFSPCTVQSSGTEEIELFFLVPRTGCGLPAAPPAEAGAQHWRSMGARGRCDPLLVMLHTPKTCAFSPFRRPQSACSAATCAEPAGTLHKGIWIGRCTKYSDNDRHYSGTSEQRQYQQYQHQSAQQTRCSRQQPAHPRRPHHNAHRQPSISSC